MKLIYEIDQSALGMEVYLHVYDDHIELREPDQNSIPTQRTRAVDSFIGNVAKITKMMVFDLPKGLDKARYLDFNNRHCHIPYDAFSLSRQKVRITAK